MYKPLKADLWREVDTQVLRMFGARPAKSAAAFRAYPLRHEPVRPFLVAEYSDVAGGRFSFCFAIGNCAVPTSRATYVNKLAIPPARTVVLFGTSVFALPSATIYVELAWQTPPHERVLEALQIKSALPVLHTLGVTMSERHHLLSFDILESMGVKISPKDYESVVVRFRSALVAAGDSIVRPAVEQLVKFVSNSTLSAE